MDKIEKIRQKIDRMLDDICDADGFVQKKDEPRYDALVEVLSFLDTLEEEPDKSLDEAAEDFRETKIANGHFFQIKGTKPLCYLDDLIPAFIAGYKLHEANTPLPEDTVIFQKGVEEGKRLLIEKAVECSVCAGKEGDKWIVSYIGNYESMLKTCKGGDKVRIIVCKKED